MDTQSDFLRLLDAVEGFFTHGERPDEEAAARTPGVEAHGAGPKEAQDAPPAAAVPEDGADSAPVGGALEVLCGEIDRCSRCPLSRSRKRAVAGEGHPRPLVLVIGEGPGADEDRTGRPFVGRAGQYLDRWLTAVRIGSGKAVPSRETNTYISNVVKCRPPGNRDPLPEEIQACLPYLERLVDLLKPRAILTLGRVALHTLTGKSDSLASMRGRLYTYRDVPLVPTYHPSAVLREMSQMGKQAVSRARVWDDLKRLKALLENEPLR